MLVSRKITIFHHHPSGHSDCMLSLRMSDSNDGLEVGDGREGWEMSDFLHIFTSTIAMVNYVNSHLFGDFMGFFFVNFRVI